MAAVPEQADDAHDMLRDAARDFARRALKPGDLRLQRERDPAFDAQVWQSMAAMGWTGLLVAEAEGGSDAGLQAFCTVLSEIGGALPAAPLVACGVLAAVAVQQADHVALGQAILSGLAAGTELPALAFESATSTGGLRAQAGGGRWTLQGERRFVRPGRGATGLVAMASTEQGPAMFWLRPGLPGMAWQNEKLADGGDAAWVRLADVQVSDAQLLVRPGRADTVLRRALDAALIATAAELLGVMRGAMELALAHLRTRRQFGVSIGSFQALQHRAADLYIQHELTSALVERASRAFDDKAGDLSLLAAHAKARAADAALLTAREAVQFHGAMGYTDECDVGLYLKRSLALSAWLGNPSEQRRRYAGLRFMSSTEPVPA